jgi:hypothetical protein
MREFKFFKGQSKPLIFESHNDRLPLNERWVWINTPTVNIADFDWSTGAIITTTHNVTTFYGSLTHYVNNLLDGNKTAYIFDISTYYNDEEIDIPYGTTLEQLGIYDWASHFKIISLVI